MGKSSATYEYTIIPDGDKIEQEGWPLFGKEKFPNYEIFWQKFVAPRTKRIYERSNIHPLDELSDLECEIMSMHWQIFSNFYYIYKHLPDLMGDSDEMNERFDHSFIKLSNSCDLIEELIFKLLFYLSLTNESKVELPTKEKFNELKKITNEEVFAKLMEKTGSVSFPIDNRFQIIKRALMGKEGNFKKLFKGYEAISGPIRQYRNVIAHSWQSFMINGKVPTLKFVKKYKVWVRVTRLVKSDAFKAKDEMVKKHYVVKVKLINEQADNLIEFMNIFWEEIIKLLPSPPDYKKPGVTYRISTSGISGMALEDQFTTCSGTGSIQLSGTYCPPPSGCTELDFLGYKNDKNTN